MIFLLTGNPSARPALVDMGSSLTKEYGMLFLGHIKKGNIEYVDRWKAISAQKIWLQMRKVRGFYVLGEGDNLLDGCKRMIPVSI